MLEFIGFADPPMRDSPPRHLPSTYASGAISSINWLPTDERRASRRTAFLTTMTALELHRQNPSLDLAPILRVIKYMGFDSNSLAKAEIDQILKLYPHFERDPELVVGIEAVCRLTDLEPERLSELLGKHRHEIPYLGTKAHPMVPKVAIDMIRAIANGGDPMAASEEELFTLTEMAEQTDISLASLSKYVKEQPDRVPSRTVGRMRKFPREAIAVFQQIKAENMGRRGNGNKSAQRQKAAINRRYAVKLADLEERLETAVELSRELARTLNRLSGQIRRARAAAETGSKKAATGRTRGARRSGGQRPDTIVAACKRVLAQADGEMRVAEITERVIAMGTPIKAKNPNVTVSSILSSYDDFARVRRGYYELIRKDEKPDDTREMIADPDGEKRDLPTEDADDARQAASSERDPEEILAGLQAAAASSESMSDDPAGAASVDASSDASRTPAAEAEGGQSQRRSDGMVRLEPSKAAG